jgi:integrase/recombinase XerD
MKTRACMMLWHRTDKANKQGLAPLSCRLTVNGKRVEISTNIRVAPKDWSGARKKVLGTAGADVAKRANSYLLQLLNQLEDIVADFDRQSKPVTAQSIARSYRSGGSVLNLLGLFEAFLAEREGLLGVEFAPATIKQNKVAYNRLSEFLKLQVATDLRPEEMTHNMADKMAHWMLAKLKHKRVSVNKVIRAISQVLTWGVQREYIEKNPLHLYKYKRHAANEIKFLTEGELAALTALCLPVGRVANVRDCFVLQCWTGLAYADLVALNVAASAEYRTDAGGTVRRLLRITRAKSTMEKGYEAVIPLMAEAERILALYNDVMPVPTNQEYNQALKELGALAGISADKMHSHVGRKTAGTLMLNRGVTLPAVSKFLGHSSTLITQKLYAKLLDTTVVDAFGAVFGGAPALAPQPIVLPLLPAPHGTQKGGRAL